MALVAVEATLAASAKLFDTSGRSGLLVAGACQIIGSHCTISLVVTVLILGEARDGAKTLDTPSRLGLPPRGSS